MKAVRFHSYGGPEVLVLEEVPRPQPEADEVLIRVQGAGVNPLDWKARAGHVKEWLQHRLPVIPGWDASGVVEEVGQGVTTFKKGDRVYGMLNFKIDGAYADYVVAKAQDLAPPPESIDPVRAGAVPLAALTAWQALFNVAGLASGQSILIHAAAGGVGHFAVQFARWKGARVIGTASAENASFLRDLGAAETIDYTSTRFEEAVREVDVVFDLIGGDTQRRSWQVLKKGGILVATLGISFPEVAREHQVRGEGVMVQPDSAQLAEIASLIDADTVNPVVTVVLPLAEAARAHEQSQAGHTRGKIVLQVCD